MSEASLSVASRVKAHISTPYIAADGHGPRNVDGTLRQQGGSENSKPLCMLSPKEFHEARLAQEREANNSKETTSALVATETRLTDVQQRLADQKQQHQRTMREHHLRDAETSSDRLTTILENRRECRKSEKEAARLGLAHAYIHRNDSAEAWRLYIEKSKPSDTAQLRELEETVHSRRAKLAALANASVSVQRDAIVKLSEQENLKSKKKLEIEQSNQKVAQLRLLEAQQRAGEAELERKKQKRLEEAVLKRRVDQINAEMDGQIAVYESRAAEATQHFQTASIIRIQKEVIADDLIAQSQDARASKDVAKVRALYDTMQSELREMKEFLDAADERERKLKEQQEARKARATTKRR